MFGDAGARMIVGLFNRLLPFVLRLVFKVLMFTGVYWFFICLSPFLIAELLGYHPIPGTFLYFLRECLGLFSFVPMALTTVQNLIRLGGKPSFSFLDILGSRKEKKGFQSKFDGEEIVLTSRPQGVVFGKIGGKYVSKPETIHNHTLIIGGTGSGKTSGIVIPTLISWQSSVFAIDIKGELYEKTRKFRNEAKIKIFNPEDSFAYGYDPYYVLRNTNDISGEARALALSICPLPADIKEPFWIKSAQNMLTGFIVYFFVYNLNFSETMKTIKYRPVRETISQIMLTGMEEHKDNKGNIQLRIKERLTTEEIVIMEKSIPEISQFSGMDDRTLSGVFAELSNHITVFATSDDLQRALSGGEKCLTPYDLVHGYDIYCCIPQHKLDQWKDLLGMMCNQFLKTFERRPESSTKPILFFVDEFPSLGKIDTITTGLATLRSKKIHIALCIQSKSQLDVIYGEKIAEVIADNCPYKAILRASEPKTQAWCDKLVGSWNERKYTITDNHKAFSIERNHGTSNSLHKERIILPEEFAYLKDVVCLFPDGYSRIEKIKYWLDKAFMR